MKNKPLLAGIAFVVIAVIAFVFIQKQKHDELVANILRKTTLIIGVTELPETLNPILASSETARQISDTLFDGMTNLSGERVDDFQLALASEMMQDGEKLNEYTVELNTELSWHDDPNHKLSAADVRFTYEAIINPANDSPLRGRVSKLIDHVKVEDPTTVLIVFKEAVAPSRVGWVLPFKIIPATYYGKPMSIDLKNDPVAQEFNKRPIGTGPFKFTSWEGNNIVLTSNSIAPLNMDDATDATLAAEAKIRTIDFTLVHDKQKQAKMMMDGKLDLALDSNPDLHSKLDTAGLNHSDYVPHYFYALALNTKKAPFNDKKARRGLALSVDRTAVAATVWKDAPEKYTNKGPFPHNGARQYETLSDLNKYSAKKAKKMLKKAAGTELTLLFQEEASNANERIAGKLVQMFNEMGLKTQQKALGLAFDTQLQKGNFDLALVKHSGFTKGYDITPLFHSQSSQNFSGYAPKGFDDLLTKWQSTGFWTEKLPLSKRIHNKLLMDSPYVFLFTLPTRAYHSARLSDVTLVDPSALLATIEHWQVTK